MNRKVRKAGENALVNPEQMSLDSLCGMIINGKFCGGKLELAKSWELKGRGRKNKKGKQHKPTGTIIDLFKCAKCGGQVRNSRKLPEKESVNIEES